MALLEREAELAVIAAAVEAARRGNGSIVLVSGPAGIGKTAVLAAGRPPDGVRRLAARGGELERELALGVARELLEPALTQADAAARARLHVGAGLALAVLDGVAGGEGDQSAILHGLHRLVANLARERPLLLEVDDVQWADAASMRFLAFLAHRITALPAVLLLARRSGEPVTDEAALRAIVSEPHSHEQTLAALSPAAGTRLVRQTLGNQAEERFCRACHAASAGNPFVLRELVNALLEQGVPADAEGAARVAEAGPPTVARWVLARLARLPAGATELARAVAVLGEQADVGRAARLGGLSLAQAESVLDALIEAELLTPTRPLGFVHPVVRAAVHDATPPGQRSQSHRSAARLLRDQQSAPGAVAMHLLVAEPAGEGWVAHALLDGARAALAQGAPEVAARHVERALAEPPPTHLRPALLRALGNAERRLGRPTADERFLAALETTTEARARAEIVLDMLITGAPNVEIIALVRDAMRNVAPADAELALALRARLLIALETSGEPLEPEISAAEQALADHLEDTFATRLIAGMLARHAALRGRPRRSVSALACRAVANDVFYARDLEAGYPHVYALTALAMADELELAERRYTAAVQTAEQRGSIIGTGIALYQRAFIRTRRGTLVAAIDDARRAVELATGTSEDWLSIMAVAALVEALAEHGDIYAAEATLERHGLVEGIQAGPYFGQLAIARSLLRLAGQRPLEAHADAVAVGRFAEATGLRNPVLGAWRCRAALSLIALGRTAEARELAREELAIAEMADVPSVVGAARRVLALATGGNAAIPLLRDAVAVLESAPTPLELARGLTDLGAALRRTGQRQAAREPLARALELAHRHGAAPLANTARTELLAAGARPRRVRRSGVDALTVSERRIAELAAAGLSNAEIAARLFITTKTAEHHLAAIYRKLDICSRRELPAALNTADVKDSAATQLASTATPPR